MQDLSKVKISDARGWNNDRIGHEQLTSGFSAQPGTHSYHFKLLHPVMQQVEFVVQLDGWNPSSCFTSFHAVPLKQDELRHTGDTQRITKAFLPDFT
jgi:hypothetical protein